jgi:hypothetical protein
MPAMYKDIARIIDYLEGIIEIRTQARSSEQAAFSVNRGTATPSASGCDQ